MQVNLVPPTGPARSPGSSGREALLSQLLQALQPDETAQARHAQNVERHAEKLRRKDERQDAATAQTATELRPSERMQQAERDMAPGSHAAHRAQWRQAAQQAEAGRREFRRALADASERGRGERPTSAPHAARNAARSSKNAPIPAPTSPAPTDGSAQSLTPARAPVARVATRGTPGPVPAGASRAALVPAAPAPAAPAPNTGASATVVATAPAARAAAGRVTALSSPAAVTNSAPRSSPPVVSAIADGRGGVTAGKHTLRPVARGEGLAEGNSDANVERIVRIIQARIGKDRAVTTLRLDPPELGTIRLHMDLRQEQLLLRVETQTPEAQRLLSGELDTLRRSLEAAGIHLERVEVRSAAPAPPASEPQTQPQAEGWTGAQQQAAREDAGSAGGGLSWEPEAPRAESPDLPGGDAEAEPAAESLVNVLA